MSKEDEIRREIVNHERRIRELISKGESPNSAKISEIRSKIVPLKYILLESENDELGHTELDVLPGIGVDVDAFVERISAINKQVLSNRYLEKYSSKYYSRRKVLAKQTDKFLEGPNTAMILLGKAGSGKSVFACGLADNPPDNHIVLLQDSSQIDIAKSDIDGFLSNLLEQDESILACCERVLDSYPNKKILLLFDAINEHSERNKFTSQLSDFINKIEDPRIKVLMTCRMPIWETMKRYLTIPTDRVYHMTGLDSFVEIDLFSQDELRVVYDKYKEAYKLKTIFDDLSNQVKFFIANPLFLRMTAEVYSKSQKPIPKVLALREVFSDYIVTCLGEEGYESEEFRVLQRIIEVMYQYAKQELELAILRQDSEIGQYIVTDYVSPYSRLVDEGLLSQKFDRRIVRKIEKVFVTYERVFEYLLAEFIIGEVSIEEIIQNLELARSKSFIQLRGAIELALSFSILSGDTKPETLIELAELNRSDSRQFIIDVVQTIHESGHRDLAEKIIVQLSEAGSLETEILASQTAYQLGLEKRLILLSLSGDDKLREISTLFLYERWNYHRKRRDLDSAYWIFHELGSMINILYPQQSKRIFQVLASITGYMFVHIIDDPGAVYPVFDFFKELLFKVPGTKLFALQREENLLSRATDTIIETLSLSAAKIMRLDQSFEKITGDKTSIRAMIDIGELTAEETLLTVKDEFIRLFTWDDEMVSYFAGSLVTHHIYFNFEEHISFIGELIYSERLETYHKVMVIRALTMGLVSRLLHQKVVPVGIEIELLNLLLVAWNEMARKPIDDAKDIFGRPNRSISLWKDVLLGILHIEAFNQKKAGNITGSNLILSMVESGEFAEPEELKYLIEVLEKSVYQGFVEFSILTIFNNKFRVHWEDKIYESVGQTLARCRGLYQTEIDSMLDEDEFEEIFDYIRVHNNFPDVGFFLDVGNNLWGQATVAINMDVEKAAGVLFLELADATTVKEGLRRMMRTALDIMDDPDRMNIAHYQWGLLHDPDLRRRKKFEIPENIENVKPELHEYYGALAERVVKEIGLGILHDQL